MSVSSPGLTIWLGDGTYTGTFTSSIVGASGNPVIVKPVAGARPIIDGKLVINGSYSRWIGIEVFDSSFTDRESAEETDAPTDIGGDTGIDILGDYIEVANCFVHDVRRGFSVNAGADGTVVYGNLVYFTGWKNPVNYYGHGIYPQNNPGIKKYITNNFFFDNFGYNMHVFTTAGNIDDFYINKNTAFDAGILVDGVGRSTNILVGGQVPFSNPEIYDNRTYMSAAQGTNLQVGHGVDNTVTNAKINNNLAAGASALTLVTCVPSEMTGNSLYGTRTGFVDGDFPTNTYGAAGAWTDQVFLEANTYDANRAHLTIYNKSAANTVSVDVSSVFSNGDTIQARNVQDYFNDIQTLTVSGGSITINMQAANRSAATPVGWTAPAKTCPQFGAFILVKQ
jgi:hypothetical protein